MDLLISNALAGTVRADAAALTRRRVGTNRLLDGLPLLEREYLESRLEDVKLDPGDVLCEAGARVRDLYFPRTAIVSLMQVMPDGMACEIAIVGNDGLVGYPVLTGGDIAQTRAVVQVGGDAYRLRWHDARSAATCCEALARRQLRYLQALLTEVAQNSFCIRRHSVQQQLCRWLLLVLDRQPSSCLRLTQEAIANTLGVRREGISDAASALKAAGILTYSRGVIRVLDRDALERAACDCYRVVQRECGRLLLDAAA